MADTAPGGRGPGFWVLGHVEVRTEQGPVGLGGARARGVLAALLLHHERVVSVDQLVDAGWGNSPPSTARIQVQNRISVLRSRLRLLPGGAGLIARQGSGYLLRLAGIPSTWSVFTLRSPAPTAS